jgi:hypothetical protein
LWVRGCKQLGSLGVVSFAVIVPGGVSRDRRAVHRDLRDALRRFLRSRRPSRSSLGRGSLAFPAARHGLHRSCFQGADLRGPNRGVGPGLSSRGCDPSWPSSRTDDVLDTWSGWRVPGRLAASVYPPEGTVTRSAPSWASSTPTHCVTDPRIVALAPCRGLRGSLAGLLSWTSQRSPPSTSAARVHSQRGGFEALPNGVQWAEANWSALKRLGLEAFAPCPRPTLLRSEPATARIPFRPCRFSRLRRLSPHTRCRFVAPCSRSWGSPGFKLALALCSGDRQADARFFPEGQRCLHPWRPTGESRPPLGGGERTSPMHPGVRAVAAASRRSASMPGVVREVDCPDRVLANLLLRVIPPTFAPAMSPSPREVGSVPPALVSHCLSRHSLRRDTLRSFFLAHSLVRFQGYRSCCLLVVAVRGLVRPSPV